MGLKDVKARDLVKYINKWYSLDDEETEEYIEYVSDNSKYGISFFE